MERQEDNFFCYSGTDEEEEEEKREGGEITSCIVPQGPTKATDRKKKEWKKIQQIEKQKRKEG